MRYARYVLTALVTACGVVLAVAVAMVLPGPFLFGSSTVGIVIGAAWLVLLSVLAWRSRDDLRL